MAGNASIGPYRLSIRAAVGAPDPRDARIPVLRVADQRQEVGDQRRDHAELPAHALRVADLLAPAIHLHHPVARDALGQVLVVGPDADLLDARVLRGDPRGGGQRVVGLELDHRPHRDAHRGERLFQGMELRPERAIDAFAGLVVGPELVPERLDDVIGGDAEVGGALLDHLEHGVQQAGDGAEGLVLALVEAAQAVEMAEQLVGAVQDMDDHSGVYCLMPSYAEYLKVNELLALQRPLSEGPEHDEMLFIVIHQVYELWFRQILHELDHLSDLLAPNDGAHARGTLKRILTILKVMVAQLDILETMTPLEFLSFRDRLEFGQRLPVPPVPRARVRARLEGPEGARAVSRRQARPARRLERRLASRSLWDAFLRHLAANGVPGAPAPTSSGTSPGGSEPSPALARGAGRDVSEPPRRWPSCASGWWTSTRGSWSGGTGT